MTNFETLITGEGWKFETKHTFEGINVWVCDDSGHAYDICQTGAEVKDNDILYIPSEGVVGVAGCWPIAVTCGRGNLHTPADWNTIREANGDYEPFTGTDAAIRFAQEQGHDVPADALDSMACVKAEAEDQAHGIKNIEVGHINHNNATCAVSWESADGSARFHFWADLATLTDQGTLFKNCPLDIKYREAGYFDARQLNPEAKANAATVAYVKQVVETRGLVAAAIQAKADELAAEEAKQAEAARIHRIKEHGPDLLEALKALVAPWNSGKRFVDMDADEVLMLLADANLAIAAAEATD